MSADGQRFHLNQDYQHSHKARELLGIIREWITHSEQTFSHSITLSADILDGIVPLEKNILIFIYTWSSFYCFDEFLSSFMDEWSESPVVQEYLHFFSSVFKKYKHLNPLASFDLWLVRLYYSEQMMLDKNLMNLHNGICKCNGLTALVYLLQ